MTDFAWGLIGPGTIAHQFAEAVAGLPGTYLHSVLSREPKRAQAFATTWTRGDAPAPKVAADLSALLDDPRIDGVYIATPHSHHAEFVRACLEAGKPVLCEKPMVPGLAATQALVDLARSREAFLMEALWTRFLPLYAQLRPWLAAGAIGPIGPIGPIRGIQSSFCFAATYDPRSRLFDPALAGGAMMDIGIYNLAVIRWVLQAALGECPEPLRLQVDGLLAPTGVDLRVAGALRFPNDIYAQFFCAIDSQAENGLQIIGERGHIRLPHRFWQATEAVVVRPDQPPVHLQAPFLINGFEGEIEATIRCVRAGRIESEGMPHAESLALARWLDQCRAQLGVRYPFET